MTADSPPPDRHLDLAVPQDPILTPVERPADRTVSPEAAERMRRGVAANTTRAYTQQWEAFGLWCATGTLDRKRDPKPGWAVRTVLPATAETLLEYVSHLIAADRAPATIEQAVAAIRTHHRIAGFNDSPDTQAARLALRGYRRDRAVAGKRARKSAPVTVDVLRRLLGACDPDTLAGMRDRVLLVLGYVLFSRRSELSALQIEDVEVADGGLYILIRASKTDQDAEGVRIPVKPGLNPDTDPIGMLDVWLTALAERGITEGPLLRAVTRNDTLRKTSGPNGTVGMSGEAINERLRVLAKRADVRHADRITAHSLRSGPATTAAKRGTPVSAIADQGRWSPTSPVVFGYIREADRWNQYPDIGL